MKHVFGKIFLLSAAVAVVVLTAINCATEGDASNYAPLVLSGDAPEWALSPAAEPITQRSWTNERYVPQSNSKAHARHIFDLTLPSSGDGPFPLLVYIHGGGFTGGSKGDIESSFSNLKNYGFAVASIQYRLLSGNTGLFPDGNNDCLAAIRHLKANAETYHIDTNRVAVAGFSAGAYYTAFITAFSGSNYADGIVEDMSLGNPNVSSRVHAAVSWSALTDFALLNTHQNQNTGITYFLDHDASPEGQLLGGNLKDNTDAMKKKLKEQNPLNYVCANTPPILMQHGTSDNLVPWQQSEILVNKINEVKGANYATFDKIQGAGHGGFSGKETMIREFLQAKMPAGVTPPEEPPEEPPSTSIRKIERVIR